MTMALGSRSQRGFTLIELLASAAILGVLASVAVPVVQTTMQRERERELRTALRDIRGAIDSYKLAVASGKIAVAEGASGCPPSLPALVAGVQNEQDKNGPRLYFLRRLPRDPFFADRSVAAADTWGKRRFDSPPDAPQEGADVFDVYSRSTQTGLNGVPYAEW